MDTKKPTANETDHPPKRALEWILANGRNPTNGRAWNMSSLSTVAGLARSHVERTLANNPPKMEWDTADKIARAANVRTEWILTGKEPREPYEATAAPVSAASGETVVVPDDAISEAIYFLQMRERVSNDPARVQAAEALSTRYRRGRGFSSADEVLEEFERLVKAARKIGQRVDADGFAADLEKKTTPKRR